MKKFTPCIWIHNVELHGKEDGNIGEIFCFLSYKQARKFVDKNAEEFKDYKVSISCEPLWLFGYGGGFANG